ncbi:MAG: DUF1311 domain-containing protein [Proteobacteria bacterium]|nr:DUF1311 domain-containing protein [Pseudomonadota bacterium]
MTFSLAKKIFITHIILFSLSTIAFAEPSDPNFDLVSPQTKTLCQQTDQAKPPAADIPDDQQAKQLKNCDAASLYYGFTGAPDVVKARQCAFVTKNYGVLAMIYANAKGVERNLDLAIQYACKAGFAADEIEARVMHLVDLKNQHWQGDNFDLCDDVTSGYMMGVCADVQQKLASSKTQKQMAAVIGQWSESDKKSFEQLLKSANQYFEIRGENEVDLSGTDRVASQLEEEQNLRNDFYASLVAFEKGQLPQFSQEQADKLDQDLNSIYKKIQRDSQFTMGSIDRAGVKKTQLQWLKYREAWVEFGKQKYPKVTPESWRAWLTKKRVKMLQELAGSD